MKMKKITMKFQEPLTKVIFYQGGDYTQEEILCADVEGIRKKVKKELTKVIKSINMVRIMSPALFDVFKFHVMRMEMTFDRMICFTKVDDLTYYFIYPMDMNALISVKDFASKLGPLKKFAIDRMKGEDLQIVKVLREKEIITAFEKFSFAEMKLAPGSWSFSTEEVESDPEAASQGETTQTLQSDIPQSAEQATKEHQTSSLTTPSPELGQPKV